MEALPLELQERIWKDLNIEDVLHLCETSQEYKHICDNSEVWYFYLRRDFGILYQGYDPKTKYIVEYTKMKAYSEFERTLVATNGLYKIIVNDEDVGYIIAPNEQELVTKIARMYNEGQLADTIPDLQEEIDTMYEYASDEGIEAQAIIDMFEEEYTGSNYELVDFYI